jgi:ribosomal protein S18 acetylase RimI-like enzyme
VTSVTFSVRPLGAPDQSILWDIFHVALWDPPPAPLRPRSVLEHPDVRIYAEEWGRREGDVGVAGEVEGHAGIVGACWMRLIRGGRGLAYLDDETPQLGIALFPEFQRRGYGERLMRAALDAARAYGYRKVVLTVHPENPAGALYRRCGFEQFDVRRGYLAMVNDLARANDAALRTA